MKRFLEEYKKQEIDIWGITTGNEPLDGFWAKSHNLINSMGWVPIDQVIGKTVYQQVYQSIQTILDTKLMKKLVAMQRIFVGAIDMNLSANSWKLIT